MRTYAYIRIDHNCNKDINYFEYLYDLGYQIPRNRIVIEQTNINIPFEFRNKIINLLNHMESGDSLIISSLDALGSCLNEIYDNIQIIFDKKINLVILDFSKKRINNDIKIIFLHFLKLCSDFESKVQIKKKDISKKPHKVGRPELLNQKEKEDVLEEYKKGESIYSLAKKYSVTRTVIQRIISKSSKELKKNCNSLK